MAKRALWMEPLLRSKGPLQDSDLGAIGGIDPVLGAVASAHPNPPASLPAPCEQSSTDGPVINAAAATSSFVQS